MIPPISPQIVTSAIGFACLVADRVFAVFRDRRRARRAAEQRKWDIADREDKHNALLNSGIDIQATLEEHTEAIAELRKTTAETRTLVEMRLASHKL